MLSMTTNYTGTNPLIANTDSNRVNDGDEVAAVTDPLNATSYPGVPDGDMNADRSHDAYPRRLKFFFRARICHLSRAEIRFMLRQATEINGQ